MNIYIPNQALEKKVILKKYRELLSYLYSKSTEKEQIEKFNKAFSLAVKAHKDMRRRSGEPYIYHPIAVAEIVSKEMNLGTRSMIAAMLHDVVEDTDYTLEDIKDMFGEQIAKIINGLTKIEDLVIANDQSAQAENFRKILMYTSEDVRVILVKLADRLHNMRTLSSMPPEKQLKISSETTFFFVPIAHRLGLYRIKSELEDLAMQYNDPTNYNIIKKKLKINEPERKKLIEDFVRPIVQKLKEAGIDAEMSSRTKSIFSIHRKMEKKGISFEDVYDVFAVRFVINSSGSPEQEINDCWRLHTIITNIYDTNPDRLRNFLTTPKANGYQALHVTCMSTMGKWVEVQIRTQKMDQIAERGLAAHFKYKEENASYSDVENRVEDWLAKIRDMLKSQDINAINFLDEVKMDLTLKEIILFTPTGERRVLPAGSTVLDFAYDVHTRLGNQCIGAKVNFNIQPINYVLHTGDQVKIITSKKQYPKPEWFNFAKTSRAKEHIKEAIRDAQKTKTIEGQERLKQIFENLKIEFNTDNIARVQNYFQVVSDIEFWSQIAEQKIKSDRIQKLFENNLDRQYVSFKQKVNASIEEKSLDALIDEQLEKKPEFFLLDDNSDTIKHLIANCCSPIPGDQVVGIQISHDVIEVHATNCKNAIAAMSKYGNRIIKAKWRKEQDVAFLTGITIRGFDRKGMIKEIISIVTSQLDLNIRSINIATKENVFSGKLMLYIQNVKALNELIENLSKIDQLEKIERIAPDFD